MVEREVEVLEKRTKSVTVCDNCCREVDRDDPSVTIDACSECEVELTVEPPGEPVLTREEYETDPDEFGRPYSGCDSMATNMGVALVTLNVAGVLSVVGSAAILGGLSAHVSLAIHVTTAIVAGIGVVFFGEFAGQFEDVIDDD